MISADLVQLIAIMAIPAVLAITLHEAAHGWVAARLGDPTARNLGRLSLNPLRHVDPVGTILVPLSLVLAAQAFGTQPLVFGWAKPVPVNPGRLRSPRRDMALVALAGPGANLLMGVAWAACFSLVAAVLVLTGSGSVSGTAFAEMVRVGILINAVIMMLNLLPLPPLDGGRVLVSVLPWHLARLVAKIEPFGLVIMVIALLTGVLWSILGPLVGFAATIFVSIGQLPLKLL